MKAPTIPPPMPFSGPETVLRHGSFPNERVFSGCMTVPEEVENPASAAAAATSTQEEEGGGEASGVVVRLASGMGSVAAPDPSGDNGLSAEGESVASALISGVASLPFSMTKAKECFLKNTSTSFHTKGGKICPLKNELDPVWAWERVCRERRWGWVGTVGGQKEGQQDREERGKPFGVKLQSKNQAKREIDFLPSPHSWKRAN